MLETLPTNKLNYCLIHLNERYNNNNIDFSDDDDNDDFDLDFDWVETTSCVLNRPV